MASASSLPVTSSTQPSTEDMPLLGRVGDAVQRDGKPLYANLFLGTAILSQVGIILLTAAVWTSILTRDVILFSYHPLFNSAGILLLVQAILILQPTHTITQKRSGTIVHAVLIGIGFSALVVGLIIIEYNKFSHNGAHFKSTHAILGFVTYGILVIQTLVGFTQYFMPSLYGGVTNAKVIYKYHRMSGYVALLLMLAAVVTATKTTFNINALHIKTWIVVTTSIMIIIGVFPRIKLHKLGYRRTQGTQ
ncbi:putative cytochrome b561 [Golovinomyces cichoracearum]|uniref:Putative cytochrome b561 n=1 Tax=Golovinomyces cichoracearum TaxID=62708 RepID=A0A420I9V0_9PEZI|nr:putative cytochrome b561 [Golovinomyces cichoracearum]